MIIDEFEFILKDGRHAIIRSPKEEDIVGMLDYLYKSAEETDFILRYPEECSKYTVEGEKEVFKNIIAQVTGQCLNVLWRGLLQVIVRLLGTIE